jgi:hypothetical protein
MSPVVDFHVHVLPDVLGAVVPQHLRKRARDWYRPVSSSLHKAQTVMRHLPETARRGLDGLSGIAPLPGLLFESTPADLKAAMDEAGVDHAVVIAAPPVTSNELVLETCAGDSRLIPVVNIAPGVPRPGAALKRYVKKGARMLKIHCAVDGEKDGVNSARYRSLLKAASELGIPVILHTGCIHTRLFYKAPKLGRAELFKPWFSDYPDTTFILAHMNFHEPGVALDLAEDHPNLLVDTSWQPAEVIGEAVRRIGAERVLFGTDWPLVGHNLSIGIDRVRECVSAGTLNPAQADLILGGNAVKLLGLADDAAPVREDARPTT